MYHIFIHSSVDSQIASMSSADVCLRCKNTIQQGQTFQQMVLEQVGIHGQRNEPQPKSDTFYKKSITPGSQT